MEPENVEAEVFYSIQSRVETCVDGRLRGHDEKVGIGWAMPSQFPGVGSR
jgi:hypothetical protein